MMEQAQEHFEAGRFAEAEALYRAAIKEDAANTEALFMLALSRRAQGDLNEALDLMARAATQDPDNVNIHYTLGTLHMSRRSVDEARNAYLKALQIDPFHVDSHNGVAFAELIAGNFSAAERAANLALTEDDRNVQALVYLGTAKLEGGDSTRAIAYLQEALKEAPGHQAAQLQLGRAFMADDKAGFAMQCFENVVQADPKFASGWEHLAQAQVSNGLVQEASQSFQQAFALGRKNEAVINGLAECEKALGNDERAAQVLEAAGQARAQGIELALTGAEYEISRGNPAAALAILDAMDDSGSERATVLRATALEQKRDEKAAVSALAPLIDGGKASPTAQLAYARLLIKTGREAEADEIIGALLAAETPPPQALMFRGFQLCRRGDENGIAMLQEIEHDDGLSEVDQRRVNRMLATSLDAAGRFDEAAGYYLRLSGRMPQVLAVAESTAKENRGLLENDTLPASAGREDADDLPADPVFLLTWPGSGWEWLAAGLGAHPGVMLVADKPDTQAKRRALINQPVGAALSALTPAVAGQGAARYWADLEDGGLVPGARSTVDTLWLSVDMLPTLAALFPAARVIVLNEDPRQLALEWLRAGYPELNAMAKVYMDQSAALRQYRERLNLEFIDVDGSALKQDPVSELVRLTGALKLPWDDRVGERLQGVSQSTRAGRGNWQDYQQHLQEALAVLDSAEGETED
jgi:cytochrome c-type biogenesis protein CcmH/NrfG